MEYFTLEQANQAILEIRPRLAEVFLLREKIQAEQPEIWVLLSKIAGNGGNRSIGLIEEQYDKVTDLVREILASGAVIKDLDTGLVDFLSIRDGREIFLCWRYGEEQVSFWHELDSGFIGRQPI